MNEQVTRGEFEELRRRVEGMDRRRPHRELVHLCKLPYRFLHLVHNGVLCRQRRIRGIVRCP